MNVLRAHLCYHVPGLVAHIGGCNLPSILHWIPVSVAFGLFGAVLAKSLVTGLLFVNRLLVGSVGSFAAPALGASLAVLLIWRVSRRASGFGTDQYIKSLSDPSQRIDLRLSATKLGATCLTVGSGGSGGLVGPTLLIGAGLAQLLALIRRLMPQLSNILDPRTAHMVGAASMLGALLGAPLAAAVLVVEVPYRTSIEYRALLPALVGSTSGALFHTMLWGTYARPPGTLLPAPTAQHVYWAALAALLGVLAGLSLLLCLRACQRYAARFDTPLLAVAGALLVGLLAYALGTEILGWGMQESFNSWSHDTPLSSRGIWLGFAKSVATALTAGTGASGGLVGPAVAIGALIGNGVAVQAGIPLVVTCISAMAACLSTVSNVPLAASLLMLEVFGLGAWMYAVPGSVLGFVCARQWVAYDVIALRRIEAERRANKSPAAQ